MTENAIRLSSLHDLLYLEASRMLDAELVLLKQLNVWTDSCFSLKLKNILHKYAEVIGKNITGIENFSGEEDSSSIPLENRAIAALVADINEKLLYCNDSEIKDACLLAGIQSINHLKISVYGTAAAFAKIVATETDAAFFHEAEAREKQVDDRLSQLAEFEINQKARTPVVLTV